MDPETAKMMSMGLGQAIETGYGIYDRNQQRKLDRRQMRLNEQSQRWRQLMDLVQSGQQMPQQATAMQRMIALRNAGR